MDSQKITIEEIAAARDLPPESFRSLGTTLSVGFLLSTFLLAGLFVIILGIGWVSFVRQDLPAPPSTPATLTAESVRLYKETAEVYRELSGLPEQRALTLFQAVATILMASFNLIVGYILGSRDRR